MAESEKGEKIGGFIALVILLVIAVFSVRLYLQTKTLTETIERQQGTIAALEQKVGELTAQVEAVHDEMTVLKTIATVSKQLPVVLPKNVADAKAVKPGLYVLEKPVTLKRVRQIGTFTKDYTLYHIKTRIGTGALTADINIGIATAGIMASPQFYLDYDGDNAVDASVMREIVDFVPMGGVLAKSLDEFNAQSMYNTFLQHHQEAEHLSPDRMDSADGVAGKLWAFVSNESSRILESISPN